MTFTTLALLLALFALIAGLASLRGHAKYIDKLEAENLKFAMDAAPEVFDKSTGLDQLAAAVQCVGTARQHIRLALAEIEPHVEDDSVVRRHMISARDELDRAFQ